MLTVDIAAPLVDVSVVDTRLVALERFWLKVKLVLVGKLDEVLGGRVEVAAKSTEYHASEPSAGFF